MVGGCEKMAGYGWWDEIMAGHEGGGGGVVAKLWLGVGDCGWWWQNYGWLWVVMDVCGWSQDLRTPVTKTQFF